MKRILNIILAAALVCGAATACEKDGGNNGGGGDDTVNARMTGYSITADGWTDYFEFTYNAEGKVSKIEQYYLDEGTEVTDKEWNLAYNGNTISLTGYAEGTFTLGENGYVSKYVVGGVTYDYTYNNGGFLTQIKQDGTVVSNIVIVDDCISTWSRFTDGVEEPKVQTYASVKNIAGLHTTHNDKAAPERRAFYEAGLFGRTSAYMTATSGWQNSTDKATFTYDYDENGLPVAEHKDYPGWPEEFEFTWDIID